MRRWHQAFGTGLQQWLRSGLVACLTGATFAAWSGEAAAAAEKLAIPFSCQSSGNKVTVSHSITADLDIVGTRSSRVVELCEQERWRERGGACLPVEVHSFDLLCGDRRVAWPEVASAIARRARMQLRIADARIVAGAPGEPPRSVTCELEPRASDGSRPSKPDAAKSTRLALVCHDNAAGLGPTRIPLPAGFAPVADSGWLQTVVALRPSGSAPSSDESDRTPAPMVTADAGANRRREVDTTFLPDITPSRAVGRTSLDMWINPAGGADGEASGTGEPLVEAVLGPSPSSHRPMPVPVLDNVQPRPVEDHGDVSRTISASGSDRVGPAGETGASVDVSKLDFPIMGPQRWVGFLAEPPSQNLMLAAVGLIACVSLLAGAFIGRRSTAAEQPARRRLSSSFAVFLAPRALASPIDGALPLEVVNAAASIASVIGDTRSQLAKLQSQGPLVEVLKAELSMIDARLATLRAAPGAGAEGEAGAEAARKLAPAFRNLVRDLQRIRRIVDGAVISLGKGDAEPNRIPSTRSEAFGLLGLNPEAPELTVKKVADGLRMSWHPDYARDEGDRRVREARVKAINAAVDIINGKRSVA